jgi:hypothetical protein
VFCPWQICTRCVCQLSPIWSIAASSSWIPQWLIFLWNKDMYIQANISWKRKRDQYYAFKMQHVHSVSSRTLQQCVQNVVERPTPPGCLHALWISTAIETGVRGLRPGGRPPPSPTHACSTHCCRVQGRQHQFLVWYHQGLTQFSISVLNINRQLCNKARQVQNN